MSGELQLEAGTTSIDAWMYENGGGTCFMLAWKIDDGQWEIVAPEFFTSEPLPSATTSTLETTTTEPSTTTTVILESTTTTSIYQPTTTAQLQTTTALPQTTSSVIPLPIPQPVVEVVATTSIPATTTIPEPLPETTLTTSPQTSDPLPPATTAPTIPLEPSTSLPEPPDTSTSVEIPSTSLLASDEPLSDEQFEQVLTALSDATPEQISEIVTTILNSDLSTEQAEQLVASPEILAAVTPEQAQQLFQQVEETQLSEAMAAVIADALNDPDVPAEVKEAFEDAINIFGNDGFDQYVPVDSAVTVAVRRTIIAGTTILVALPSPAPVRRT